MYKLLLVDDNRAFLESFEKLVDWDKYGFEVVAKMGDGCEVLEFVAGNYVDAIITDIKMPEVSGVDLTEQLSRTHPDIKIVFFSAFRDFKYAMEAIKYDVVGYISKPIMLDQLEMTLNKLHKRLEERRNGGLGEFVDEEVIRKREELFCGWLSGEQVHGDFLKKGLSNVNILYQSVYVNCAYVIFNIFGLEQKIEEKWKNDEKNLYEAIVKSVCVDTQTYHVVKLNFTQGKLAVVYVGKYIDSVTQNCVNAAIDDLKSMFGLTVIADCYMPFETLIEFKGAVAKPKKPELKYLKSRIEANKDRQMFETIEKYVDEHYAEDIGVEKAAKQCHFNERYFSRLFKKMTGKKYVDYVNEIRVEKAKKMIEEGDSIDAVSGKVGYGSRRYLDKQFIYYMGETPAQYRRKMLEENRNGEQKAKT